MNPIISKVNRECCNAQENNFQVYLSPCAKRMNKRKHINVNTQQEQILYPKYAGLAT